MASELINELAVTISSPDVLIYIAVALVFALACLATGVWAGRVTGIIKVDDPVADTIAIGLSVGLLVVAATWATLRSAGQSSFTVPALGFAGAVAFGVLRRRADSAVAVSLDDPGVRDASNGARRRRGLLLGLLAGGLFIVVTALIYGSTIQEQPRDGLQPIQFVDEAYYAVLGEDLSSRGIESMYGPSGFDRLDDLPEQNWYHWGEVWLASALVSVLGIEPISARSTIVLPVVLLASAGLVGVVVRQFTRDQSTRAFLFGFAACLFLAPVPYLGGPLFAQWAVGFAFGVLQYGLGAVSTLLALVILLPAAARPATRPLLLATCTVVAFTLPAHFALAILIAVGVAAVVIAEGPGLATDRGHRLASSYWSKAIIGSAVLGLMTIGWGLLTGHGLGSTAAAQGVSPFNETWMVSVAAVVIGSGAILAVPAAALVDRPAERIHRNIVIGTIAILVVGAVVWGARLYDFNLFHLFFGGLVVIATPVAACGIWMLGRRLRGTGKRRLSTALMVAVSLQLGLGVVVTIGRLQGFGTDRYAPVPETILAAIRGLPADAKLAYACQPFEEFGFAGPALGSIGAHTHRRIVPLCFQADVISTLVGAPPDPTIANPFFQWAPQRALYPTAGSAPSPEAVLTFMRQHGIGYIYVDELHPDSLVPGADRIVVDGAHAILKVPGD